MGAYKQRLDTFSAGNLPTLDEVVLGALDLFCDTTVPEIDFSRFKRPLVVGSGNAAVTGRLLFAGVDAVFADESSYIEKLDAVGDIDGAVLISSSGSKHALPIAAELKRRNVDTVLCTNNADAPAKSMISSDKIFVFPKNREPYTYNTSTYMGMILSKTKEDPESILSFIEDYVAPIVPTSLTDHGAYYFIFPEHYNEMREMIATKFNELFGPQVMGRIFTAEQTKHAKTVVPMEGELFVSFGEENTMFGEPENRIDIPLPDRANYAAMMAISYYVVGCLQKQLPPYYMNRISGYVKETSQIFGSTINIIVE